jgi:hypothetical protein
MDAEEQKNGGALTVIGFYFVLLQRANRQIRFINKKKGNNDQ